MAMCVSGVYALMKDTEIRDSLSTGIVNIELETYNINEDGEEIPYREERKHVMPGNEISLIPKVFNKGEDCYIRAKIDINNENLCSVEEIPSCWIKHGDYYYLDEVFTKDSDINIFAKVKIADTITEENLDSVIIVTTKVEAIQEKNFEPDYTLNDPWKGEEIEKCIERTYSMDDDSATTVTYNPDSIEVISKFFDGFHKMMPGDEITRDVTIVNKHSNKTEVFMDIIGVDLDDETKTLLEELTIIIKDDKGNVIYKGSIWDYNMTSLGKFDAGENKIYSFSMIMPASSKNKFSQISSKLNWGFYTEDEIPDKESNDYKQPKTGDFKFDVSLGVFYISTIGLIIVMILGFIDKRKNN